MFPYKFYYYLKVSNNIDINTSNKSNIIINLLKSNNVYKQIMDSKKKSKNQKTNITDFNELVYSNYYLNLNIIDLFLISYDNQIMFIYNFLYQQGYVNNILIDDNYINTIFELLWYYNKNNKITVNVINAYFKKNKITKKLIINNNNYDNMFKVFINYMIHEKSIYKITLASYAPIFLSDLNITPDFISEKLNYINIDYFNKQYYNFKKDAETVYNKNLTLSVGGNFNSITSLQKKMVQNIFSNLLKNKTTEKQNLMITDNTNNTNNNTNNTNNNNNNNKCGCAGKI